MQRRWALAVIVGLVAVLPLWGVGEDKALVLKVLLPQDDAEITVNDKAVEGEGKERRVTVTSQAKDKKFHIVTGHWEPNNYTKFTRTRKVPVDSKGVVTVDLTKAYDTEKIKIRWVATPDDVVGRMCKLANVTKKDTVYDIGCGDGVMVFHAVEKFGAKRGVGIDIDRDLLKKCTATAKEKKLGDKVEFKFGDALEVTDVSDADVVLLYMGDDVNLRLRPALKKTMKPGGRVVSHRFEMGDWRPARTETFTGEDGDEYTIHLWVIEGEKKKDQ